MIAALTFNRLNAMDRKMYLYDTFAGMPDIDSRDEDLGTGPFQLAMGIAASPLAPIIEMILGSGAAPGAPAKPGGDTSSIPFPFSLFFELLKALESGHGQGPGGPPKSNQPSIPFNYVGVGVPHDLLASPPVIYNGRCYPPEFFPNREVGDLVDIPDETTRQWWQHWPANYAWYLAESGS